MGKHSSPGNLPWRRALRFATNSNVALGLTLAILAWPYDASALVPQFGMDPGWSAALEMVAHQQLPFGTHVVFAYGPLGFLAVWPVYFTTMAILGFLFLLALYTAVFATLVWSLRRVVPVVVAFLAAFVAGTLSISAVAFIYSGEPEKGYALALVVCIYALTRSEGEPLPKRVWVGVGFGLGIMTLLKTSVGVGVGVAVVITILFLSTGRRTAFALLVPSTLVTFAIGWFGTGNGFDDLSSFVRGTAATISGYSAAVATEDPSRWYTYWFAAAVVTVVIALATARSWHLGRRTQVGVFLVTIVILWQLFKEGFVRHDIYHDPIFFACAPLLIVAFVPPRRTPLWAGAIVGAVLATSLLAGAITSFPTQLTRPTSGASDFVNEVNTIVVPGDRSKAITTSRELLQEFYAVPGPMLGAMLGHTVDVDPWEQTLLWAYPGLKFDPLPTLQTYNAYTTSLDQQDASYLISSNAPRYFLRQRPAAFDNRDPAFEPPATQLALECRYLQVEANSTWQLVVRSANRCGSVRPLSTVSIGLDEWVRVPVPQQGRAIVASFQLPLSLWWQTQAELFKPPSVYIVVNGGTDTYRFVPGTAASLHVLRPASTLGYDSEFAPQTITNLLFTIDGEGPSTSGVIVHFYEVSMAGGGPRTRR